VKSDSRGKKSGSKPKPKVITGDSSSESENPIFEGNERLQRDPSSSEESDGGHTKKKRKLSITTNSALGGTNGYTKLDKHGKYPIQTISSVMKKIRDRWICPIRRHQCCSPSLEHQGACVTWSSSDIQDWATAIVTFSHTHLNSVTNEFSWQLDAERGIGSATIEIPPSSITGTLVMRGGKRGNSISRQTPQPQGVNLTVITSGGDTRSGSGPMVLTGHDSARKHSNFDRFHAYGAILEIPLRKYDKIADFLTWLEAEYDDPDCDFRQFTEVLTGEEYLGFRRICEIVDAVPQKDLPAGGGTWLKTRIESLGALCNLSEGTAHAIFQGMWRRVQQIRQDWVSEGYDAGNKY
jgi:hypothetical protein